MQDLGKVHTIEYFCDGSIHINLHKHQYELVSTVGMP